MAFILIFLLQKHHAVISQFLRSKYFFYSFFIVIVRFFDSGIKPCIGKAIHYSIVPIGISKVSKKGFYFFLIITDVTPKVPIITSTIATRLRFHFTLSFFFGPFMKSSTSRLIATIIAMAARIICHAAI